MINIIATIWELTRWALGVERRTPLECVCCKIWSKMKWASPIYEFVLFSFHIMKAAQVATIFSWGDVRCPSCLMMWSLFKYCLYEELFISYFICVFVFLFVINERWVGVEAYSLPARTALTDNDGWWWEKLLMMTCWWYDLSLACHHYIFIAHCEVNELLYYMSLCLYVFNLKAKLKEAGWRISWIDTQCWSCCKMWFSIAHHDLLFEPFILFAYNIFYLLYLLVSHSTRLEISEPLYYICLCLPVFSFYEGCTSGDLLKDKLGVTRVADASCDSASLIIICMLDHLIYLYTLFLYL